MLPSNDHQQRCNIRNEDDSLLALKVFAIPELLEVILILLSPKDILLSQRVSVTWNTIINSSKRLRQALFIDPVPAKTVWIARPTPEDEPVDRDPNTFQIDRYTITQPPATDLAQHCPISSDTHITTHVSLNTLIHTRGHFKPLSLSDRIERGEGLRLGRTRKKILGHGRNMFLTQPPCTEVLVWVDWGQPHRIVNESGVRFGEVLSITENAGTTLYLPHMFMMAKGCISLTEAEERMVEEKLENEDSDLVVEDMTCSEENAEGAEDAENAEPNRTEQSGWVATTVSRLFGARG